MKWWLSISLPLYVADQLTKYLAQRNIATDEMVPVIPGVLNFVHVHNTGAAFGMMRNNNLFFIALSLVALTVITVLAMRGRFHGKLTKAGAALLVSGVMGNLTDRFLHQHVIDFIDVILPWYGHWPAFNIADSCICVAAAFFIISSFLDGKRDTVRASS